jgi:hypothetical protein
MSERGTRKPRRTSGPLVELLNPAVNQAAGRPANCEYPSDHGGELHSPLDWSFSPSHLLTQKAGCTFLKLVRGAIDWLLT